MPNARGKDAEITERQMKAMQLRVRGFTFPEMANELDVSVGTAYNDYKAAMKRLIDETRESADQVRSVEITRLDRMIRSLELAAFGPPDADAPFCADPKAIEVLLKVSDRRAKLLGLDAPEDLNVNFGEVTPEKAAQLVREKFGDHAAKRESADGVDPSSEEDTSEV